MHKTNKKNNKLKKTITTITLLALLTNCTTTKHRDQQLVKTLKLQNETIKTLTVSRSKNHKETIRALSEADQIKEQRLLKTLNALADSNNVVMNKLKPVTKKECNCGKDERTND